jgi:fatty-acyl-CoA synthase
MITSLLLHCWDAADPHTPSRFRPPPRFPRLSTLQIAFILTHSEAKALILDSELVALVKPALDLMAANGAALPLILHVQADVEGAKTERLGKWEYEDLLLKRGSDTFEAILPVDEFDSIAVGYTSGTTGDPKGVLTSHRGAYLAAMNNVIHCGLQKHASYLWTLPMFHCNG